MIDSSIAFLHSLLTISIYDWFIYCFLAQFINNKEHAFACSRVRRSVVWLSSHMMTETLALSTDAIRLQIEECRRDIK